MKITNQEQWARVQKAITNMVLDQPFFAALLFRMKIVEDVRCPTACTNGIELRYGPEFVSKLSHRQLVTLLAHEVMHPAMGHLWRLKNYPHDVANIAADHEENLVLEEENEKARSKSLVEPFPFPEGALMDARFKGMAAERIAEIIMKEMPPKGGGGSGDGDGGSGSDDGKGIGSSFGEFEQPAISEDDVTKLKQEWEVDVINAAKAAKMMGRCPGQIERLVDGILNPKKSWRELLKEFVKATCRDDYSWSRVNQRYAGSGFILPALHSNRIGTIVYIRDTSGSMVGEEKECNGEVQGIMDEVRPERTIVIDCDAEVHQVFELSCGDEIAASDGAKMRGGGGTDFRPAFEKVNDMIAAGEEIACVIFFTDLYGTFPETEPAYPVLWAATTDTDVPWGVAVRLNE